MKSRILPSAALIFGSGLAALLYQTTWLREFRLIFGNSTAASAAVLGIFMGGLGLGSALLGKRAESTPRPLAFYAKLEFLIAISAALTPAADLADSGRLHRLWRNIRDGDVRRDVLFGCCWLRSSWPFRPC